jgi:hypothetical protein
MLTIDLLKGQGVPVRSNLDKIAFTVVALEIPIFIAIMLIGCYLSNNINISIKKQKIVNYEKMINKLSESAVLQNAFEKEKKSIEGSLSEVAATINNHNQWTPVLVEIVKTLPDSVLLKGISVKQDTIKKRMPKKGTGEIVDVAVSVTILRIDVSEKSGLGREQPIRDFQDSLRSSAVIGSRLDNITISQGVETFKGQDFVSYQIDCVFKPQS